MSIYLQVSAPSGQSYAATVERLSDGYFRQDDAETFSSGLAFADKDISLTEESQPNLGSYRATLDGSAWSDGVYRLRIHNLSQTNRVETTRDFGVVAGNEVSVGEAIPIYHADVQFIKDNTNTQDEYRIRWFKNGVRVSSGITNTGISVIKPDGTKLVNNQDMTQVGTTGSYRYYATTVATRQTAGETYEVVTSGTIDSATRRFSWILSRDSS